MIILDLKALRQTAETALQNPDLKGVQTNFEETFNPILVLHLIDKLESEEKHNEGLLRFAQVVRNDRSAYWLQPQAEAAIRGPLKLEPEAEKPTFRFGSDVYVGNSKELEEIIEEFGIKLDMIAGVVTTRVPAALFLMAGEIRKLRKEK